MAITNDVIEQFKKTTHVLNSHEGKTATKPDGTPCSIYSFVCIECEDRCEYVRRVLENANINI